MSHSWDSYWESYEAPDYVNQNRQLVEMISAHLDLPTCRVLEIGVGTGGDSSAIAALGALSVALDISTPALYRARTTATARLVDLDLVQGDALNLPFESGSFDLVFHQGLLEHFVDPGVLMSEQRRVLRTSGYLAIDVPQRYNLYTAHKHRLMRAGRWPYGGWETEYSLRSLSTLLRSAGFRVIDAYGRGHFLRPFRMLQSLRKIERVLGRRVASDRFWRTYDRGWEHFQHSWLGCNTLQCLGVLAVRHRR